MDIKGFKSQNSVEATPLKPVYESIDKKQDRIKNSDDIKEGNANLFYSASRTLLDLKGLIDKVFDAIAKKQDILPNSDALREGPSHLFYTEERVKTVIGFTVGDILSRLSNGIKNKQELIESSDSIAEGAKNLYFSKDRIYGSMKSHLDKIESDFSTNLNEAAKFCSSLKIIIDTQAVIIAKLSSRIVAIETKETPAKEENMELEDLKKEFEEFKEKVNQKVDASYSIPGASHRIKIVVDVVKGMAKFQEIEIRGGQITRVLPVI